MKTRIDGEAVSHIVTQEQKVKGIIAWQRKGVKKCIKLCDVAFMNGPTIVIQTKL